MATQSLLPLFALCSLCLHALPANASKLGCPGNTSTDDVFAGLNWKGKLAIVTGGDSGLGYSTAHVLAKSGAQVIIATHNLTKGRQAAAKIAEETGADVSSPWQLDLASLVTVRKFASEFLAKFGNKLHVLVNDAGIGHPSKLSQDGFELVFQVDYLGHFLLTDLLLPALRKSSPSRVVNVASGAHENACESAGWPEGCFKDFTYLPPPVVPKKKVTIHYKSGAVVTNSSTYGIPKFLQTQHAAELAVREKANGVKAFSLTPGFALSSMTDHIDPKDPTIKVFCQQQVHPDPSIPANPCPFATDQGAAAIAYALASQDLKSGSYISRTWACEERPVVMHGMTPETRSELYRRSLLWVGLSDQDQMVV